jgi:co-chaperonin GroES (HSP10)
MISNGNVIFRQGISNAWVESSISTSSKEKAVVGVYSKSWGKEEEDMHAYNAIGEGQVLVTDQGGDIEVGDYICSSDVSGHGMKQDDDILHNYTVAKALENISFANVEVNENGDKSILIACTYHCG